MRPDFTPATFSGKAERMAITGQIRCTLRQLLDALETKLAQDEVLDATRITRTLLTSPDDLPILGAPQDLWVTPLAEVPDVLDGAQYFKSEGRADRRMIRTVQICIRSKQNLDKVGSDKDWTDLHLALEDSVFGSLDDHHLYDGDSVLEKGNQLTTYPLEAQRLDGPKRMVSRAGWGASMLFFAVGYRRLYPGQDP